MKFIHERIRALREDRDLKQYVIAEMLEISQQQYSRYETGETEIPVRMLSVIARYYEVSVDYIVGHKDFLHGVPGLDKQVTKDKNAGQVLTDILSLEADSRETVVELIALLQTKECCAKRKNWHDCKHCNA